jgi:hypothetical protein
VTAPKRRKFAELRGRTVRTPEAAAKVEAYKAAMRDALAIEAARGLAATASPDQRAEHVHKRHDGFGDRDDSRDQAPR